MGLKLQVISLAQQAHKPFNIYIIYKLYMSMGGEYEWHKFNHRFKYLQMWARQFFFKKW